MALTERVKTALDETRLLILGSQILFGFQLNAVFQKTFDDLSPVARWLNACGFLLMATAVALLIAPSMQHRLVEGGRDSERIQRAATRFSALALFPFALSIGLTFYIVLERHAGAALAAFAGAMFFHIAMLFWFGIESVMRPRETAMRHPPDHAQSTPIHTRIEQMLTEARVLLPGAQAMLGFQFAVMLTATFDRLAFSSKLVHVAALSLIALAVILLMTPAAIHRLTFDGNDTERFHRIGSRFVIAAAAPLGLGISLDMCVAIGRATGSAAFGTAAGGVAALLFIVLWFVQPLLLRRHLVSR
jgi:uncharacterized protein DUF6328